MLSSEQPFRGRDIASTGLAMPTAGRPDKKAMNPSWFNPWANSGRALRAANRSGDALRYYDRAIEINPNVATPWESNGNCLLDLSRYSEAVHGFDRAIAIDPNSVWSWYGKGIALEALAKVEEALSCLERTVRLEPRSQLLQECLGRIRGRLYPNE